MLRDVKRSPQLSPILAAVAAVLLVVQAVWLIASPDTVEGPILIVFDRGHGLTVSDLAGVALTLVALGLWFFVVFAPAAGAAAAGFRGVEERTRIEVSDAEFWAERSDRHRVSDPVSVR